MPIGEAFADLVHLAFQPLDVLAMFRRMPLPYSIPAGLRRRIDSVLGLRNHGSPEIWGEVRDWLEEHGVEKPASVTVEQPPEGGAQRDQ